jgi:hypothetical protein
MRLKLLGAAFAAVMTCAAAESAVILAQITGTANGTLRVDPGCNSGDPNRPECAITTRPLVVPFDFQTSVDLVDGSGTFFFQNSSLSSFTGTVVSIGNGDLAGSNLTYTLGARSGIGFFTRESGTATAATFQVFQISPAPVPEPTTWAMMLVGFGAVGYSMRKRPKVHAQLT